MGQDERLSEQRKMRDFSRTAEPSGEGREKGGGGVSAAEKGHG